MTVTTQHPDYWDGRALAALGVCACETAARALVFVAQLQLRCRQLQADDGARGALAITAPASALAPAARLPAGVIQVSHLRHADAEHRPGALRHDGLHPEVTTRAAVSTVRRYVSYQLNHCRGVTPRASGTRAALSRLKQAEAEGRDLFLRQTCLHTGDQWCSRRGQRSQEGRHDEFLCRDDPTIAEGSKYVRAVQDGYWINVGTE
eukprot:448610-Prorocentrum_minimum.AAC.3